MPLVGSAQIASAKIVVSLLHPENVYNRPVSVDGSKPRKSIAVNAHEENM